MTLTVVPTGGEVALNGHRHVGLDVATLQRELLTDNLLVRIHLIIMIILVDRPCPIGVWISFSR